MQSQNKGFSFIEIIVVISIMVLLAFIGLNYGNSSSEKVNNTKTLSDLETIKNAMDLYSKTKKSLPMPGGNNFIYDSEGLYSHDWENVKTFGVSGFITENTLPKSFMNFLPTDSKTKQYYGYAKKKSTLSYQVAGIIWENGEPKSSVVGNYGENDGLVDLIKEYNGPNFVYNKSKENFPFSPDEKELTARIRNYTGSVNIVSQSKSITGTGVLDYILREGDKINTPAGSYASIYYSDGSKSILGNNVDTSNLTLQTMKYEGETNLITKVKLALGGGTVWNDITKLNSDGSEFEINTSDVVAAVRGTEFGIRKNGSTNVTLKSGKVDLKKDVSILKTIEVKAGETATGNNISSAGGITPGTGAQDNINEKYFEDDNSILKNIIPKPIGWTFTDNANFEIKLNLNDSFKKANHLKIGFGNEQIYPVSPVLATGTVSNYWGNETALVLNGDTQLREQPTQQLQNLVSRYKILHISFCNDTLKGEVCSADTEINLRIKDFNQDRNDIDDQTLLKNNPTCATGFDFIEGYLENGGCVENKLYDPIKDQQAPGDLTNPLNIVRWRVMAYAPYNRPGDLTLYKYQDDIQASSSGIVSVTDTNEMEDLPDNCSDKANSFCEDDDGTKGIFMDKQNSLIHDYIKYDVVDLLLRQNYAIEMRVKVPSILENKTYYLIHSGDFIKLFIFNGTLFYNGFSSGDRNLGTISTGYQTITLINEKGVIKAKIGDGPVIPSSYTLPYTDIELRNILVGVYENPTFGFSSQFNELIDYVKIYKKAG